MLRFEDSIALEAWLERKIKRSRFIHSLGVAEMAGELMKRFGYCEEAGVISGLYHDAYRYIELGEGIRICREHGVELYPEEEAEEPLVHGPVAAALMREDLGKDVPESYVKAVRNHTLGSSDMGKLGAAVYIADYAEKGRKHLTESDRAEILALPSLEAMVLHILKAQDEYFRKTGKESAGVTKELERFLLDGGEFEEDPSCHIYNPLDLPSRLLP